MIYSVLIVSFLLEASLSTIVSINSLFAPLFLLTSLTILFPYFKNKKENFFIVCLICGLFYDIAFYNSIFVNTISFAMFSGFVILCYNYINYNIFNSNFLNIFALIFYRIISYLILCIVDFVSFNQNILIKGIYSSILANLIYGVLIYIIINKISKIFKIEKSE